MADVQEGQQRPEPVETIVGCNPLPPSAMPIARLPAHMKIQEPQDAEDDTYASSLDGAVS